MIARLWRGVTSQENSDKYFEYFEDFACGACFRRESAPAPLHLVRSRPASQSDPGGSVSGASGRRLVYQSRGRSGGVQFR